MSKSSEEKKQEVENSIDCSGAEAEARAMGTRKAAMLNGCQFCGTACR